MTTEAIQEELEMMRCSILEKATEVRKHAAILMEELAEVQRIADQISDDVETTIHFPGEVWKSNSWERLPETIIRIDAEAKAYQKMKKIIREDCPTTEKES